MADNEYELVEDFTTISITGDAVSLMLAESPTTGYRWNVTRLPTGVRIASNQFELPSRAIGAAGVRRLRLVVDAIGEWDVQLELSRPWEPKGDALRTITCRLIRSGNDAERKDNN